MVDRRIQEFLLRRIVKETSQVANYVRCSLVGVRPAANETQGPWVDISVAIKGAMGKRVCSG